MRRSKDMTTSGEDLENRAFMTETELPIVETASAVANNSHAVRTSDSPLASRSGSDLSSSGSDCSDDEPALDDDLAETLRRYDSEDYVAPQGQRARTSRDLPLALSIRVAPERSHGVEHDPGVEYERMRLRKMVPDATYAHERPGAHESVIMHAIEAAMPRLVEQEGASSPRSASSESIPDASSESWFSSDTSDAISPRSLESPAFTEWPGAPPIPGIPPRPVDEGEHIEFYHYESALAFKAPPVDPRGHKNLVRQSALTVVRDIDRATAMAIKPRALVKATGPGAAAARAAAARAAAALITASQPDAQMQAGPNSGETTPDRNETELVVRKASKSRMQSLRRASDALGYHPDAVEPEAADPNTGRDDSDASSNEDDVTGKRAEKPGSEPASFARRNPSFVRGDSSFNRGDSSFNRGDSSFNRGDSSFNRGDSSFKRKGSQRVRRGSVVATMAGRDASADQSRQDEVVDAEGIASGNVTAGGDGTFTAPDGQAGLDGLRERAQGHNPPATRHLMLKQASAGGPLAILRSGVEKTEAMLKTRRRMSGDYPRSRLEDVAKLAIIASQRAVYLEACKKLGARPVARVLNHLDAPRLALNHYGLGPLGSTPLAYVIERNMSWRVIALSDNEIGLEGIRWLRTPLARHQKLTDLDLSSNGLGQRGAQILCEALGAKQPPMLRRLDLSNNKLFDGATQHLTELLRKCASLEALVLRDNAMSVVSAVKLQKALALKSCPLTELDVSWNSLTTSGIVAIMAALHRNSTLRVLRASWNRSGSKGGAAVAEMLTKNKGLHTLELTNNGIDAPAASVLADALRSEANTTLTSIDLSHNPLGSAGCENIMR